MVEYKLKLFELCLAGEQKAPPDFFSTLDLPEKSVKKYVPNTYEFILHISPKL